MDMRFLPTHFAWGQRHHLIGSDSLGCVHSHGRHIKDKIDKMANWTSFLNPTQVRKSWNFQDHNLRPSKSYPNLSEISKAKTDHFATFHSELTENFKMPKIGGFHLKGKLISFLAAGLTGLPFLNFGDIWQRSTEVPSLAKIGN